MELAKLNQKISIVQVVESPDGYGGFRAEDKIQSSVWANVLPFKMVENSSLGRLDKKITTKFTMRSNSQITPHHKIMHAGNIYNIARIRTVTKDEDFMEVCGFIK